MSEQKTYFIQTYGCQANICDSQIMASTLDAIGFIQTKSFQKADVIILNTCSVRQKSEDKVYGWGLKVGNSQEAPIYKKKNNQVIFVTGCMVGSAKGERTRLKLEILEKKMPWADYLLSPDEEIEIPSILVKEGLVDNWAKETILPPDSLNPELENDTEWAYVNISTGCDNFCTFCVVPYARGKEISRSKEDILKEVNHLVSRGYGNIMLVGQNVNSWGLDSKRKFRLRAKSEHKIPFADLLRSVHKLKEVNKISFISSNPFDFTKDLIKTLSLPKIDKYLHMAVQSGDNKILKKMNRRHTIEEFYDLVFAIKKEVPDMTFGTDAIVGFPGETNEQFEKTIQLFKDIRFNVAFISIYSERPGTNAQESMKDDVSLSVKKKRHARLMKVWTESLK